MIERIKRIISAILAVAMIMICFPFTTIADTVSVEEIAQISADKDNVRVLYSIKGDKASKELCQTLTGLGVKVNDKTTIMLIPSGMEEGSHAVQVTNIEGKRVTTHKLVAINDDGSVGRVNALNERTVTQAKVMGGTTELLSGGLVFLWAIQFDYYPSPFGLDMFRPLYMQINYRNTGGYNVQRIKMLGTCAGNEYTYPGLVRISSADYFHEMLIEEAGPRANCYYVNTDAYRTDRVIGNATGFGGYVINLWYTVNGHVYTDVADVNVFVRGL